MHMPQNSVVCIVYNRCIREGSSERSYPKRKITGSSPIYLCFVVIYRFDMFLSGP